MPLKSFDALRALVGRTGGTKRTAIAILLAFGVLGPIAAADTKPGPQTLVASAEIAVEARPIRSFHRAGSARRFGALEFLGGLTLTANNRHFGGWSGLTLDREGRRLLAVSDAGSWMTGEFVYDRGVLAGLAKARIGPLAALGGRPLRRGMDLDAEGVRLQSGTLDNGTVLVSFERNQRVGVFTIGPHGLSAPQRYLKGSPDWLRMRRNKGLEAVTTIDGGALKGSVIAFAENKQSREGHHCAWIWTGATTVAPDAVFVRRIGDYEVTDAVSLPDGSLVILERSFAWTAGVGMRMRLVRASSVKPGAVLDGPVLIEADMSHDIDNMEGLAVHQSGGETILTLISDDNFNRFLQRTIVLQFALKAERIAALTK